MIIKDLLGDLWTPEIEAKLSQYTVYLWNKQDEKEKDKEPIPKFRVKEMTSTLESNIETLNTQIQTLQDTITQRDKDLKDLKKAAEGNTELTAKIEEQIKINKEQKDQFEQEKTKLAEREAELKKAFAVKENLLNAGVSDPDARDLLSKKFDLKTIEVLEDGKIKGFDDMIKPIKDNKSFSGFFGQEVIAGQEHAQGKGNNDSPYFTLDEIKAMSEEQIGANLDKVNKSLAQHS